MGSEYCEGNADGMTLVFWSGVDFVALTFQFSLRHSLHPKRKEIKIQDDRREEAGEDGKRECLKSQMGSVTQQGISGARHARLGAQGARGESSCRLDECCSGSTALWLAEAQPLLTCQRACQNVPAAATILTSSASNHLSETSARFCVASAPSRVQFYYLV